MTGRRVDSVVPVMVGGNSRICRVRCDGRHFALKCYPPRNRDPRDRAGTEFKALGFLERYCPGRAPRAFAVDAEGGYLLLEWIEGSRVAEIGSREVDAAIAFLCTIFDASAQPEARGFSPASEACLSGEEVVRQLLDREVKLRAAADDPALLEFLNREFVPIRERVVEQARAGYAEAGFDFAEALAPTLRSLVPSDFGFHNAIRTAEGALIFVDYEYFGWDDPVKVTADFLLHPATPLPGDMAARFWRGVCAHRKKKDESFLTRLELLYPLFGARWCLILLNEFLPERWAGRVFAGSPRDWASVKVEQLHRSRDMLSKVRSYSRGFFYEQ